MALTTKQKLFCYYYLKLGNVKEAAVFAGYAKKFALYDGLKILASVAGREYLSNLSVNTEKCNGQLIKKGLERLAFGSVNDAVALAFSEESIDTDSLDLFNVAEIKRQKGGTVEIKFFDRQKALEALGSIEEKSRTDSADNSFEALRAGANAVKIKDDGFEL